MVGVWSANIASETFAENADDLKQLRETTSVLRDAFGLEGVTLRLFVRKPDNPYDKN